MAQLQASAVDDLTINPSTLDLSCPKLKNISLSKASLQASSTIAISQVGNMTNTTCPDAALPDLSSLPIPQNINVMAVPGSDISYFPMQACCQPNRVQVVNNCTLWCEVPPTFFNNGRSHQEVQDSTSNCLRVNGLNSTGPKIIGWQFNGPPNAGARTGMWTVKEIGVFVLAFSGLVYVL
ncbi:hypothetical protein CONLIGDRAFT_93329 [Coniochaeta ligniaria NRRL 30616]|uniref:Uncharacterized protein n=1 Tax=Coniochaeta ligniaria NRRL 30616 TaxID=1408157 RepID=A0A1J7ICJ0_9PEZI|nr:hypothetical protein CONLIGDRAFT_93329 [Coniochaeta ligniaria NRRL 30616]